MSAADDAKSTVARYTDAQILGPRYTDSALQQMGMQLSFGERKQYRFAYTEAFVAAWKARYDTLKKGN